MMNRKKIISILSGVMAAVMLLTLLMSLLPTNVFAASSSEIRKQINTLKEEKKQIQKQIEDVKAQYKENEDEILNIINKKNVIDQEVQLLYTQITNINQQISTYNLLIADKQDELDNAQLRYNELNEENKLRVRTMEEEGEVSYWEVLFHANSFSDLLDRLSMMEEIAASDNRRLQELGKAAEEVAEAREALEAEKAELESTRQELNNTQVEMDAKREEAVALFQELLEKADDLDALWEEYETKEEEFLKEIAQKEEEYSAAKQAEWEAYMATYVPPTTAPPVNNGGTNTGTAGGTTGSTGTTGNTGNTGNTGTNSSGWVVPCSYTSITSPFGPRKQPTAGASTYHQGVDLDTGTGDPVVASRAGMVVIAGNNKSAGNYVKIDHMDGFASVYMHLSSYSVSVGQLVSAGQYIGATGSTGITSGDHLHFGISYNGVYVNPCNYVNLY